MFASISLRSAVSITQRRGMGSVVMSSFGAPVSVLKFEAAKASSSSPDNEQVQVQVVASQVVHEDNRFVRGISFANSKAGGVAGVNAIGKVTAVGANVSGLKAGDSVFVLNSGSWSDSITVKASNAAKISSVGDEFALMSSYLTAWAIFNSSSGLKSGDSVIQTEGSSAIGSAITSVGKSMGFNIVSASEVDLATANHSAKLAISSLSGKPLRDLLKQISTGGSVVTINGATTPVLASSGVDIPTGASIFDNKSVRGFDISGWASANNDKFREGCSAISSLLSDKKISVSGVKVMGQVDFLKALEAVQASGAAVVLKN